MNRELWKQLHQKLAAREFAVLCARNTELVREYDRLRGTNLSRRGTGLELMIDDATGRTEDDVRGFVEFCEDVWGRFHSALESDHA